MAHSDFTGLIPVPSASKNVWNRRFATSKCNMFIEFHWNLCDVGVRESKQILVVWTHVRWVGIWFTFFLMRPFGMCFFENGCWLRLHPMRQWRLHKRTIAVFRRCAVVARVLNYWRLLQHVSMLISTQRDYERIHCLWRRGICSKRQAALHLRQNTCRSRQLYVILYQI